jgi:hypothetical protein
MADGSYSWVATRHDCALPKWDIAHHIKAGM